MKRITLYNLDPFTECPCAICRAQRTEEEVKRIRKSWRKMITEKKDQSLTLHETRFVSMEWLDILDNSNLATWCEKIHVWWLLNRTNNEDFLANSKYC